MPAPNITETHRRAEGHKHITELEVTKYYSLTSTGSGPNLHGKKGDRIEEDINNIRIKNRKLGVEVR